MILCNCKLKEQNAKVNCILWFTKTIEPYGKGKYIYIQTETNLRPKMNLVCGIERKSDREKEKERNVHNQEIVYRASKFLDAKDSKNFLFVSYFGAAITKETTKTATTAWMAMMVVVVAGSIVWYELIFVFHPVLVPAIDLSLVHRKRNVVPFHKCSTLAQAQLNCLWQNFKPLKKR